MFAPLGFKLRSKLLDTVLCTHGFVQCVVVGGPPSFSPDCNGAHHSQVTNTISFGFSLLGTAMVIRRLGLKMTLLAFPCMCLAVVLMVMMFPKLHVSVRRHQARVQWQRVLFVAFLALLASHFTRSIDSNCFMQSANTAVDMAFRQDVTAGTRTIRDSKQCPPLLLVVCVTGHVAPVPCSLPLLFVYH